MRRARRFLAIFLLFELLLGLAVWYDFERESADELRHCELRQSTALEALIGSYGQAARNVFEHSVNRPDILRLVARAGGQPAEREAVREALARRLAPIYEVLAEQNFRQFHFHLPDGTSLYRFHRPARFGDSLDGVRPSVRLAQETGRLIEGFETGRIYHGFRYVFPLNWQGELVGSVEVSIPFSLVRPALAGVGLAKRRYRLLLLQEEVYPKLFDEQRAIYRSSSLHPDYLIEQAGEDTGFPGWLGPALAQQGRQEAVVEQMDAGKLFSERLRRDGEDWVATFLPVRDVAGHQAAYVVGFGENTLIADLRREAWILFGAGSVGAGALTLLLWAWLASRRKQREDSRRLRAIGASMGEGLYVLDEDGRIEYANRQAGEILGYEVAELRGRAAHPLFHAHTGEQSTDQCPIQQATLAGQTYHSREEGFRRRDGEIIPVEVTATPLQRKGKATGVVTIFRDISSQLEMEQRLREQETLFRSIFETTGVGIALLDQSGRVLRTNEALTTILDRAPESLEGCALTDCLDAGHREAGASALEALACGRAGRREIELQYRRSDGQGIWVHQAMSLLCGLEDQPEHVVVLLNDISQRKAYERQLSRKRRQMDRVLNSAGEGIIGLDQEGRVMFVNEAACRMTGFTQADFQGGRVHDLVHHHRADGRTYQLDDCPICATIQDGRIRRVDEEVFWRRDGSSFPVEYVASPIASDEGQLTEGAVVVFQDITERRRLEAELTRRATTDGLTGVMNRSRFEEVLRHEFQRMARSGAPLSVVMFDIDHFKAINDNFGHGAGDDVLRELVERVHAELREVDSLARWGGEEFMVLLPETAAEGARALAERVRRRVAAAGFAEVGRVTISLGVAQRRPEESEDDLLRRVDDALYAAKEHGRNRVMIAERE